MFKFPSSVGGTITFDLASNGNLPQTTASRHQRTTTTSTSNSSLHNLFTVLSPENLNLTRAQKFLLEWHWRLGHAGFQWIQYLISSSVIPCSIPGVTSATCKCHACQLGKQVRQTEGTNKTTIRSEKDGNLKKESLAVGSMISTDQFVSSLKGRLPNTYGKEKEESMYMGGTVFIDEASEFIYL